MLGQRACRRPTAVTRTRSWEHRGVSISRVRFRPFVCRGKCLVLFGPYDISKLRHTNGQFGCYVYGRLTALCHDCTWMMTGTMQRCRPMVDFLGSPRTPRDTPPFSSEQAPGCQGQDRTLERRLHFHRCCDRRRETQQGQHPPKAEITGLRRHATNARMMGPCASVDSEQPQLSGLSHDLGGIKHARSSTTLSDSQLLTSASLDARTSLVAACRRRP